MTVESVNVTPSTETDAVGVPVDDISNVHYPIFKMAYGVAGEVSLLSDSIGLPVTQADPGQAMHVQSVMMEETLTDILNQMKIMNFHLSLLTDAHIKETDV